MTAVAQRVPRGDRFGAGDLLAEAAAGIGARPGRLMLTILGTVLGIASVVVTVGLAQTAAGQINKQFDAVAATQGAAEAATSSLGGDELALGTLPWDAPERAERLNGVEAAGLVSEIEAEGLEVTTVPVHDPSASRTASTPVMATSAGALAALDGRVVQGRYFDAGHDQRGDRVVVLGADAADRLGVVRVDRQPSIFIGERAYQVIGVVDDVVRRTDLLSAVILPNGTARADLGLTVPQELHLHLQVGAGPLVGSQLPTALSPDAPEKVKVGVPTGGSAVQRSVQADISAIFLALGGVALLIGGVGIANVTLLSVLERVGEIGLRRALGATRRQIAAQFMVESVVVGMLGGLVGAALGVAVVTAVSAASRWTPILDLRMVAVAALSGGLIGLLAGLYPSMKAASIEPISALRGGV
ncbi:ABC transporter permease [Cellulomonas sp. KH9]|uniref:ABC transporter permease n=1 Tax=Cellulomonas sp. KH9 TaxID=1855324 RepID=UPI0008EC253F|nr:ABC transporter permease [Cellulomonas sp. KH9]SFJ83070.1 putative ABC transport system permease protein [Cellulomonas sp. KH9]